MPIKRWAILSLSIFGIGLLLVAFVTRASSLGSSVPVEVSVPDTVLKVQGIAAPSALVTIKDNGVVLASVAADGNGFYSAILGAQTPGIRNISANFVDVSGVYSRTIARSFSVQPQQENILTLLLPPTFTRLSSEYISRGSLLQFRGYTAPGADVELRIEPGGKIFSVKSSNIGLYEFVIDTAAISEGSYTAQVVAKKASQTTEQTSTSNFTVLPVGAIFDGQKPDIVVSQNRLSPPKVTSHQNQSFIDGFSTVLEGTAVPYSQINIYENGVIIGSVFADKNGKWKFNFIARITPVTIFLEACIGDICSLLSDAIILNFSQVSVCPVDFRLSKYRYLVPTSTTAAEIVVTETNLTSADVRIDWGDDSEYLSNNHPVKAGETIFQKFYDKPGSYNGSVTLSSAECSATKYFSVDVRDSSASSIDSKNNLKMLLLVFVVVAMMLFVAPNYRDISKQRLINKLTKPRK